MYRKITIILISVFLKLFGVITQALVIFLVIIVFLILNMKLLPFKFKSLNDLEILSLMTWMVTIYCGLFYLSDIPEVYNSKDESVKEADNGRKYNIKSSHKYSKTEWRVKIILFPDHYYFKFNICALLDIPYAVWKYQHSQDKVWKMLFVYLSLR